MNAAGNSAPRSESLGDLITEKHMKTLSLLLALITLPVAAQDWKMDAGKSRSISASGR